MVDYSIRDGNQPADVPRRDAPASRPDEWVAPGHMPARAAAPAPEPLTLTYSVTLADMTASVLDHPATRKRYEAAVWRAGWRRSLRAMPLPLGLVLLANLFLLDLGVTWSVLSTVLLAGLFALVRWSQIDHGIKRGLPIAVEKQALHEFARRGDQRRISADSAGLTLADAASTVRLGWRQVTLSETGTHILLTVEPATWAIPKGLGAPLADFVRFARSQGAG